MPLLPAEQSRCDFLNNADISIILKNSKQPIKSFRKIIESRYLVCKLGYAFILFGNESVFLNYALLHFLHNAHIFNQKQIKSELWQLELNRIAKDNYRHHKYCISSFLTLSIRLSEIPKSIFL